MTSPCPGAHERHFLRRQDNPLFSTASRQVDSADLAVARQRDASELEVFVERFHELLEAAAALKPTEESDILLELKARLDHAYTMLASLGGDNEPFKAALRRLTNIVIGAIRNAAGNDAQALNELDQEQAAREQHYRLMEFSLTADLMRAESPITPAELVATLLSVPREELEAALWLFGPEELRPLCAEAATLLATVATERGQENLALMQLHLDDIS